MARVYERLRGLGELSKVRIADVVEGLIAELRDSLVPRDVAVHTTVDPVTLPARLAVSLGIIVNELITNAVKYAFGDGEKEITVNLRRADQEGIQLVVRDTGAGFPPEVLSGERQGYGLTIARALVDQHQGTMALSNADGGHVAIVMPAVDS
jgi:two-component sensor histidine kinase